MVTNIKPLNMLAKEKERVYQEKGLSSFQACLLASWKSQGRRGKVQASVDAWTRGLQKKQQICQIRG